MQHCLLCETRRKQLLSIRSVFTPPEERPCHGVTLALLILVILVRTSPMAAMATKVMILILVRASDLVSCCHRLLFNRSI